MFHKESHSILNRLLEPLTHCLTPAGARKLVELRADAVVQDRVDELAGKSTAGALTAEEKSEYESYISASTFIGILQAKARRILTTKTAES